MTTYNFKNTYFNIIGSASRKIPKSKINNSLNDIPVDIKEKIKIKKNFFIRKEIKEINPQTVFISIDIDCLDTRKKKYSSLEYCPMTILSNLSRIDIKNKNDNENNTNTINTVL